MKAAVLAAVTAGLVWAGPSFGSEVESDPKGVLTMIRTGVPPSLLGADFEAARLTVAMSLGDLASALREERSAVEKAPTLAHTFECTRFLAASIGLAENLKRLLEQYREPMANSRLAELSGDQLLNYVRIHLVSPAFFGLHALLHGDREAGFGSLTPTLGSTCPLPRREAIVRKFGSAVDQLKGFLREGVGNPGLIGFDQVADRLLLMAGEEEHRRQTKSWGLLAGTAAVSLLFWQAAPVTVLAAVRTLLGTAPQWMGHATFVFSVRSVVLATEALTYAHAEHVLLPPQLKVPREAMLATWDQQLTEAEQLSDMGASSPLLYYHALNQIMAHLSLLFENWLRENERTFIATGGSP